MGGAKGDLVERRRVLGEEGGVIVFIDIKLGRKVQEGGELQQL